MSSQMTCMSVPGVVSAAQSTWHRSRSACPAHASSAPSPRIAPAPPCAAACHVSVCAQAGSTTCTPAAAVLRRRCAQRRPWRRPARVDWRTSTRAPTAPTCQPRSGPRRAAIPLCGVTAAMMRAGVPRACSSAGTRSSAVSSCSACGSPLPRVNSRRRRSHALKGRSHVQQLCHHLRAKQPHLHVAAAEWEGAACS